MVLDITPRSFWRFPAITPTWDDDDDWGIMTNWPSGITISEDDKNVYVEAAVPGVDPKDVEVTLDRGIVWIKGEGKMEEKNKKYYRKAASSFSYRVAVPGDINTANEPIAAVKNGVMKVTFAKSPETQPKKISVREG